MKIQLLFRQIHHWLSIFIFLPLLIMIIAGIFLMLKKDFDWIQPASQVGVSKIFPQVSLKTMFEAAKKVPELNVQDWQDLDRVDFKIKKGIVKFIGKNDWEIQVDVTNGQIVQVAYRRSDWLEALHDGSFFGDGVKYYLFLPTGVALFILWLTGIYLFFLPHVKKWQKRRKKRKLSQKL